MAISVLYLAAGGDGRTHITVLVGLSVSTCGLVQSFLKATDCFKSLGGTEMHHTLQAIHPNPAKGQKSSHMQLLLGQTLATAPHQYDLNMRYRMPPSCSRF